MVPQYARIKFNGGRGALLCEECNVIIRQDFNPKDIEDRYYYCGETTCLRKHPSPLSYVS